MMAGITSHVPNFGYLPTGVDEGAFRGSIHLLFSSGIHLIGAVRAEHAHGKMMISFDA
ncbi:hypothetical protein FD28_GL000013 [Levilactobacillus hammesii DSM 16381]|uniref:Uncharacterized protein n=1 Tax=Levilactobacillus hammesii DSM 16381 TaxID=1423753 RepID=A0A0R1UY96_9LACO|nr:hypothetical protein FD28_GL000013 [Levilactobacillus hammesii DSM 16381]